MARFKARIRQRQGPRDTFIEAETEWEAVELLKGQFGLSRRDIFYIKKATDNSCASFAMEHEAEEREESPLQTFFYTAVSLLFWVVIGTVIYQCFL
ncbi:hypothetical protein [Microvirga pakistanensis]|uniref:hypothetical protein n=1 Tax=Microvirga pakistanensis TaxID=1682650 RepID=UPI00106D978B|nr:hypothetical protein [Microvirga pakistanensis]